MKHRKRGRRRRRRRTYATSSDSSDKLEPSEQDDSFRFDAKETNSPKSISTPILYQSSYSINDAVVSTPLHSTPLTHSIRSTSFRTRDSLTKCSTSFRTRLIWLRLTRKRRKAGKGIQDSATSPSPPPFDSIRFVAICCHVAYRTAAQEFEISDDGVI